MEELNKVIEDATKMKALLEDDNFKYFFGSEDSEFSKLAVNLVKASTRTDEPAKTQIEYQIKGIASFWNFVEGTVQAGEMAEEELKQLNEETNDE